MLYKKENKFKNVLLKNKKQLYFSIREKNNQICDFELQLLMK